eukprot:507207-Hanusia_phi.AAC.2
MPSFAPAQGLLPDSLALPSPPPPPSPFAPRPRPSSSPTRPPHPPVPVKGALLDQSFCAGVGNWIADEVLYQ